MTHSRRTELKDMLEARCRAIEEQVQQQIRGFRDAASAEITRPPVDFSDEPSQEDLDFALVEMQAQMLANITAALSRLQAGDYGTCNGCGEEIPENRLRALPFANKCLPCQQSAEHTQHRERLGQRQADIRRRPLLFSSGL